MGSINAVVDLQQDGDVAVVAMDNPPVNALGIVLARGADAGLRPPGGHAGGEGGRAERHGRAPFSGGADIAGVRQAAAVAHP